jgi:chromosome segregation protein
MHVASCNHMRRHRFRSCLGEVPPIYADAARARITEEDASLVEREAALPGRRDATAGALAEAIETVREAERAANQATEAAAAGAAATAQAAI